MIMVPRLSNRYVVGIRIGGVGRALVPDRLIWC